VLQAEQETCSQSIQAEERSQPLAQKSEGSRVSEDELAPSRIECYKKLRRRRASELEGEVNFSSETRRASQTTKQKGEKRTFHKRDNRCWLPSRIDRNHYGLVGAASAALLSDLCRSFIAPRCPSHCIVKGLLSTAFYATTKRC
jgi:hypothetical protein